MRDELDDPPVLEDLESESEYEYESDGERKETEQ